MLSASVLGAVFTSPGSDSIVAAIKGVAGKRGALLVVKNYTGDRLNFGLAAEIARSEGIPVEMIVVNDEVALNGSGSITGPRGHAGTVFISQNRGSCCFRWFRRLRSDRALSTNSRPAIATARHFGDPESPINVLGARYQNPELLCVQRKTEIAEFNSLCRYNNAEADRSRYSSPRQLPHALITIVTTSYTLVHSSA
jgi:hypothetical protein